MIKGMATAAAAAACLLWGMARATTPAVSFADLAKHMQYGEVKISPDGKYLAATATIKDQPVLALVELATSKGVTIHPRENDTVVDFMWANDHRVLYTVGTKVSGIDRPLSTGEIFAVNADGTSADLLFGYRLGTQATGTHINKATAERASADIVGRLRDDPNHVLIGVNSWDSGADGSYTKVYRMDVRNGSKVPVIGAPLRNADFIVDHHGVVRFAFGESSRAREEVYYRPDNDTSWSLLFSEDDGGIDQPLAFSRDDKQVYMTCEAPGMVGTLCPWDVATRKMQAPLWTSPSVSLSGLVESLDGKDVVGVRSMDGMPATAALVPEADTVKLVATLSKLLPGEDVEIVSSSDDGGKAVALASSDEDPGSFYLWDAASQKATPLLSRAAWIKPGAMAAMRPIEFKARDGLLLHGYLSMPPGREDAKHLPLVVFVHGGPFGIRDDWGYDPYVQMMATHGYAVLQVNYRGSGGYGNRFMHAGYRQWGGTMQDDVTDATQWAIGQNIADRGRICIFGGSYGGYAALEGAMKEPDLYRCAIGYVGVYDLGLMYSSGDIPQASVGESYLHAALGTDRAELAAHSPINQIGQLKANVMLIVGGADTRVAPIQGRNLHDALNAHHIAHEWLFKEDEGHGFYDEAHLADMFTRVTAFLDRNIGGSVAAH